MTNNFVQLTGTPFSFTCMGCGKRRLSHGDVDTFSGGGRQPMNDGWADLNGPAFKAYYCDPCKRAITRADRMFGQA